MKHFLTAVALMLLVCAAEPMRSQDSSSPETARSTFKNPILPSGPDPWVTFHDGFYFYMHTTGRNLTLWKTRSLADLSSAEKKVVWTPPATGPYSRDIWAPEIHLLRGKWYIYFAADAGTNRSHRMWVLENPSPDPLEGQWTFKGKVADADDKWAIDGSVFEVGEHLYMVWSGWEGDVNGTQSIYIGELENPWTIKGRRVRLSSPEYPWEKVGDLKAKRDPEQNPGLNTDDPLHLDVNEGPQILRRGGKIFLIYSACACWTDHYSLGMLSAQESGDLMASTSWKKHTLPVFWQSPAGSVYAPGHNSFFQSPDGKEDWILYHANSRPGDGCGGKRSPHMQRFVWKPDGTPDFGRPVADGTELARPSGERTP